LEQKGVKMDVVMRNMDVKFIEEVFGQTLRELPIERKVKGG